MGQIITSLKDLVSALTRTYRAYDVNQLARYYFLNSHIFPDSRAQHRNYATLARVHALTYVVYREILENLGSNQYDMPHTGIRVRQTLEDRTVSNDVVRAAREFVRCNVNAKVYATDTMLNKKLLLPLSARYTKLSTLIWDG